ncbi:unnamed protein product [Pleuronectes platessa]|uniref:Uncharacterized protein n=1 Tax=Pleuronectes platessa TaxID=8262 RepID=A0A9N7TXF6_PLEPL|nr:unnamed protein product [Pleuronectes platessa]
MSDNKEARPLAPTACELQTQRGSTDTFRPTLGHIGQVVSSYSSMDQRQGHWETSSTSPEGNWEHILVRLSELLLLGMVRRQQPRYEPGHGGSVAGRREARGRPADYRSDPGPLPRVVPPLLGLRVPGVSLPKPGWIILGQ